MALSTLNTCSRQLLRTNQFIKLTPTITSQLIHSSSIARFTSLASNTTTQRRTNLSTTSATASPIIFQRSFFWKKKPESDEIQTNPNTTVTTFKEIPDEAPKEAPKPEPDMNLKADRLGFSGFSNAFNSLLTNWPRIKTYAVYVSVGVGILFVFKFGLNTIDFFATLNFLDVGEVAFIAGLLSGIGLVGCVWGGTRFLRLRPEPIFQHALKRISTDATCLQYLGGQIQTGQFRAYSFVPGTLRMTQEQRERAAAQQGLYKYWQPRRLQLFFQVTGANNTVGMVSAEVEKTWKGDHTYNLLSVDLDKNGERIVLEGDINYKIYKGIIKLR